MTLTTPLKACALYLIWRQKNAEGLRQDTQLFEKHAQRVQQQSLPEVASGKASTRNSDLKSEFACARCPQVESTQQDTPLVQIDPTNKVPHFFQALPLLPIF